MLAMDFFFHRALKASEKYLIAIFHLLLREVQHIFSPVIFSMKIAKSKFLLQKSPTHSNGDTTGLKNIRKHLGNLVVLPDSLLLDVLTLLELA